MRVQHNANQSANIQFLQDGAQVEMLLSKWAPKDRKFVVGQIDWSDPLDAALAIELVSFRPGVDPYDA